jgi:hypothetical protein
MSTTLLHASIERSRFSHLTVAALLGLVPAFLRRALLPTSLSLHQSADQRSVADAQKVRVLARAYARTDPGFAADLNAAASRHEAQRDL